MVALKLRKVGNSVGTTFSQETLAAMHVGEGDTLFLTEAPNGFRVTAHDPEFERIMAVAQQVMKKRRNALRALAKR